ncbi:hypothetical protein [Reichenbachiella versicolor]|uniref:hypothetical protein n=1 Tax=Reichenbachiella versicolor TaxID=1821036 RepID=UPI000D6E720C|nr:hypothetical protein [Reichenbachiella versicolor]
MTLETVFTNLLEGLSLSQYESYKFSQDNSSSISENLFPIPVAEVKEVTLNINYAYEDGYDVEKDIKKIDIQKIYNNIESSTASIADGLQRKIAEQIDQKSQDIHDQVKWTEVKKLLDEGILTDLIMNKFKSLFVNKITDLPSKKVGIIPEKIISIDQEFLEAFTSVLERQDEVALYLPLITSSSSLYTLLDQQMKSANMYKQLNIKADDIIYTGMNITVDKDKLKDLPPQSIQNVTMKLNMNNVIKRTVSE